MHAYEFFKDAKFSHVGYPADITEEIRETMKDTNKHQFLNSTITIYLLKIDYKYTTKRGNKREATKYIYLQDNHEDIYMQADFEFDNWLNSHNKNYPFKAYSNVEILGIAKMARSEFELAS